MKLHRFIGNFDLGREEVKIEDPKLAHQLREVLRLAPGEEIILGDGRGDAALARIVELGESGAMVEILRPVDEDSEPGRHIVLFAAILRRDKFELVVQKATEVGAAEIVPIVTAHTVKLGLSPDRLKTIVREAAEQSGRLVVPGLASVRRLEEAFTLANKLDLVLFFDSHGSDWRGITLRKKIAGAESVGVFVGPEGGWDAKELSLAKSLKFQIVSLGGLNLRAETAATIAMYLAAQI